MLYFRESILFLLLASLNMYAHSQIFPNSSQYQIAERFFNTNPQKLKKLVNLIDQDNYGKCLLVVTTWDLYIIKKIANPPENVKINIAAQYIGLANARKKMIAEGVSQNILDNSLESYRSRLDLGKGDVNWNKWNMECIIMAGKASND